MIHADQVFILPNGPKAFGSELEMRTVHTLGNILVHAPHVSPGLMY